MCIKFESRKICVAGNQCDNSDFDFHNAEHKELPVIKISSDEGREDCQQLKPKGTQASLGTTVIAVTILLILSILFSRVTVNVLAFVLRVVFFMYIVTRYMYDARHRDFALSASFDECFDVFVFLLRASPKLVRKQGKVYLSSKHKRRGYLRGLRYQNRVLSKYLCLCTCNYPFYSA